MPRTRLHFGIQGIVLILVALIVTAGIFTTVQTAQSLVFEELSTEFGLWATTQQEREILRLNDLVQQITLGATVDPQDYILQRELVATRIHVSREILDRNEALRVREDASLSELENLFADYRAAERTPDEAPGQTNARALLPIILELERVSRQLVNQRRTFNLETYSHAIQSTQRVFVIQVGMLAILTLAGGMLIWLTNRTLAQRVAFAHAQAEATTQHARRNELIYRSSLVLSRRLDQQDILARAARVFPADYVGILLFDEALEWATVAVSYPNSARTDKRVPLADNPLVRQFATTGLPASSTLTPATPHALLSHTNLEPLRVAALVTLPLIIHDRLIGAIELGSTKPDAYGSDDQSIFLTVATSIAAAIENARLLAAEQESRRTADTLREITRVLASSFDLGEVLDLILQEVHRVIAYDSASIMLVEQHTLRVVAQRGDDPETRYLAGKSFDLHTLSGAEEVITSRRVVLVPDTHASIHWSVIDELPSHTRTWLGVPLIAQDTVLGVLNINAHTPDRFDERDANVAQTFANHAAVALEQARLYAESVTRVERELEIARQIQRNLFPEHLPELPGVMLAAVCVPAYEMGGDFYDVLQVDTHRLGIMVGDASGKSIPAAMMMAVARSTARSAASTYETPQQVVTMTNQLISDDVMRSSFVAFSYATLDMPSRSLRLTNAGQLSPLRRQLDGTIEYLDVAGNTLPLGLWPEGSYNVREVQLEPGDTVLFYTDGIVEAHNSARALFGFEQLEALFGQHGHLPPQELVSHIMASVADFAGSTPQHDDMTIVALHCHAG